MHYDRGEIAVGGDVTLLNQGFLPVLSKKPRMEAFGGAMSRNNGNDQQQGGARKDESPPDTSLELFFRAFRAVDEPETCQTYLAGHQQVLRDYGIENITSNNESWMQNPNVFCVIVERMTPMGREMVGGIRIQQADGVHPLPVEDAVGNLDPAIHRIVEHFMDEGVGELCALWNSKSVARRGVSLLLVRACISIINQVGFRTLIGICAEYTLQMFQRVGFVVNNRLGNEGKFAYPNPSYIARVLGILDAQSLDTALAHDRARMTSLRQLPEQECAEEGQYGVVKSVYNLWLPPSS